MNETLILLLGEDPDQPVRWAFVGADGVRAADTAPDASVLDALAPRAANAQSIVAVLPGEQVAMRAMPSPPRVASKFKAAAMYLLEDDLAESLDALHIAVLRRENGGAAFAVKKSIMDGWRDVFAESGFYPDVIAADFSLLENRAGQGVIVFEPNRLICAIGDSGFAAERPLADGLASMLTADETIDAVMAHGDPDTERFDASDKPVSWAGHTDDASLFMLYAGGAARSDAANLLQGGYRKRRDWRGALAPWRRAAMLAAACLVGFIAITVADGVRSARLVDRLNDEALTVHRTAFPEAANVNPRDHARRILSSRTVGPAFLSLTADFANSIDEEDQIQIDRIRYNAARNEFSVNLSFSDINDLEALKAKLTARGVGVREAGGVRRSGGRYIGELQVSTS